MMANPVGRPTKFTPEARDKIISAVKKGAPYEIACNYAGVDYSTFFKWKQKCEEGDEEFIQFFKDVKEAEGLTALIWLDKIDKAMQDGQWQAAAWKLERRHHKYFSHAAALLELNERVARMEKEANKSIETTESKIIEHKEDQS